MQNILRNPKTTFLGFAGLIAIGSKWVQAGSIDFNDLNTIWMILMSMGLIVAKDANVVGSA